jgi:signal peptidase I
MPRTVKIKTNSPLQFRYCGSSMLPIFRSGQRIHFRHETDTAVPGDVIVFFDPARKQPVVHRVVAVEPSGLITRGDHNLHCDASCVSRDRIIGIVEAAEDEKGIRKVIGGRRGLLAAKMRWMRSGLHAKIRLVLCGSYQYLVLSSALSRRAKRFVRLHFEYITLQTPEGPVIKVLHRGRVIARSRPGSSAFVCRKPYDLWLE